MNSSDSVPESTVQPSLPPADGSTPDRVGSPFGTPDVVNVLSSAQRERLRALFAARAAMLPISVSYAQPQLPADPWMIFELRKSGSTYALAPTASGPSLVPAADGMFVYVVCADDPGRVYVGVPYGRTGIDQARFGIQGHTSLTVRADVLYAGEVILEQGRMKSWGNSSGHYRPPAELRHTNLLPVTQALLPEASFTDYWQHDNAARQAELGQLRGYMNMVDPQASAGGEPTVASPERLRLRVGYSDMTLQQMTDLGAMIDGEPLQAVLRRSTSPELLQSGLADRLSFDGNMLEQQIRAQTIAGVDDLFFDLACGRTGSASLVVNPASRPRAWITRLNATLERVQTLSAMVMYQPRQNVVTCLLPGDAPIRHTALGLHLFGLYNGVRALRTAVTRGDLTGSVIAGGELAATGTSLVAEEGLQRLGAAIQTGAVQSLNRFSRTMIGVRLGGPARLGGNLARGGSLAGALITAPFDAYNAYSSFRQAGESSGGQAQDHYVDGAMASISFVTTLGLGAAGFAGLAGTGPIGFFFGAFLIIAGRTYHSMRYVSNLLDLIPLTRGEVSAAGLRNVAGLDLAPDVQDRLTVSMAAASYRHGMQQHLESSLGYLGPLGVSHVVFGDALISLRPPLRTTEEVLSAAPAGNVTLTIVTEIPQPPLVIGNAGDDNKDGSAGLDGILNVVSIASATDDQVLWVTGDGDDILTGVWNRSNLFDVRAGKKTLCGGNEADRFELQVAPQRGSLLDGALGADTLLLSFATRAGTSLEVALAGHLRRYEYRHIEDQAGDTYQAAGSQNWLTYPHDMPGPAWRSAPGWVDVGGQRSVLKSIENVVTASDATTDVIGNGQDNVFVLNGRDDSVDGGLGDDTYVIQGGGRIRVKAGAGNNRYQLQRTINKVEIDSARAGRHTLHLDFYLHELLLEARGQSVEISVAGSLNQRIVLEDIYRSEEGGRRTAVRADGQVRIVTRDALAVTPLFARCVDADSTLIELLAKPITDPPSQGRDWFATAQEIQQLDALVAMSDGWQADTGVAAASAGSLPDAREQPLLASTTALAA